MCTAMPAIPLRFKCRRKEFSVVPLVIKVHKLWRGFKPLVSARACARGMLMCTGTQQSVSGIRETHRKRRIFGERKLTVKPVQDATKELGRLTHHQPVHGSYQTLPRRSLPPLVPRPPLPPGRTFKKTVGVKFYIIMVKLRVAVKLVKTIQPLLEGCAVISIHGVFYRARQAFRNAILKKNVEETIA